MNSDPRNTITSWFQELEKEIKGVERTFVFPRVPTESSNTLQQNLKYLTFVLSEKVPGKISIQTLKGRIVVYVTEHFFLGAVETKEANPTVVEVILQRITAILEDYLKTFKTTDVAVLEQKIQKRIEGLTPCTSIKDSTVTLVSRELEVEGLIQLTVTPQTKQEDVRKRIQSILNEEIPFFCTTHITIEIKSKFLGLLNIRGLRRQQLSKVIQKIQAI